MPLTGMILRVLKRLSKWIGRGVLVNFPKVLKGVRWVAGYGATKLLWLLNRRIITAMFLAYYVVVPNLAAIRSGSVSRVVRAVGTALVSADVAIEQSVVRIVRGASGLGFVDAVLVILGAVATYLVYVRASNLLLRKLAPMMGVVTRWGIIIVFYGLIVIAVSAVTEGSIRVPFTGVLELVQNVGAVFDPGNVVPGGGGNVGAGLNGSVGNTTG